MFYVIIQRKCSFFRKNWVASQRNVRKTVFYANDVNPIRSRNFTKSIEIKIHFDQFPRSQSNIFVLSQNCTLNIIKNNYQPLSRA